MQGGVAVSVSTSAAGHGDILANEGATLSGHNTAGQGVINDHSSTAGSGHVIDNTGSTAASAGATSHTGSVISTPDTSTHAAAQSAIDTSHSSTSIDDHAALSSSTHAVERARSLGRRFVEPYTAGRHKPLGTADACGRRHPRGDSHRHGAARILI